MDPNQLIVSICISFIVALLGIAYPILIQTIARLQDKYSSGLIIKLFNKEKVYRFFQLFLLTSLVSIVIMILNLPRLVDAGRLN